jgi:hypothetical protein
MVGPMTHDYQHSRALLDQANAVAARPYERRGTPRGEQQRPATLSGDRLRPVQRSSTTISVAHATAS